MLPNFNNGAYARGMKAAVDVIMALAKGEYNSDQYSENKKGSIGTVIVVLIIIFAAVIILFGKKGGGETDTPWGVEDHAHTEVAGSEVLEPSAVVGEFHRRR